MTEYEREGGSDSIDVFEVGSLREAWVAHGTSLRKAHGDEQRAWR